MGGDGLGDDKSKYSKPKDKTLVISSDNNDGGNDGDGATVVKEYLQARLQIPLITTMLAPIQEIVTSFGTPSTPSDEISHYFIPYSSIFSSLIKNIFDAPLVEPLSFDWSSFLNKPSSLLEHQGKLLSRVMDSGDIQYGIIAIQRWANIIGFLDGCYRHTNAECSGSRPIPSTYQHLIGNKQNFTISVK